MAINEIVNEITSHARVGEWIERLNDAGVPCGPIYDLSQVFSDPQVQHQKMVLEVDQPSRRVKTLGFPVKLSRTPAALHGPAPQIGEHTALILEGAGYTAEDIRRFTAAGVI